MLANRVTKNVRRLRRWREREGISCYRVYDCDIPEIPLTVDRYDADDGAHAVISLWQGRRSHPEAWVEAMRATLAQALELDPARTHLKTRARQEGLAQYDKLEARGERHRVREGGLTLLVNFEDYLDTGLFLDHRPLRGRLRAEAAGKDVLNLFAYTGTLSVFAAAGGARRTTSVDMSRTYLEWARANLSANGFEVGTSHALVRADVLQWLATPSNERWDIAVVDPPTFSNSKKMRGHFDVQRDHGWLLDRVGERMRPGGVIYFSTNARRFRPEWPLLTGPLASDISHQTVPADFRNKKIHRAWRVELP